MFGILNVSVGINRVITDCDFHRAKVFDAQWKMTMDRIMGTDAEN
ncbi:BZ3500_MvSof-1268-A1-R1_Chr2-1g04457 [Microbotryum saponariae]|uniref:BZ3500_MvSof-1268-A1-R1_Chr2-1g04457 protein n=1 Tax=Microbotryum saponariae TaxID=289078 RepID=A0A2X0MJ85_9BASI|nr:BZ3500_MvSof-1268-A1-R1_Chr2-1g04457 [Microbotryum saponariae]SCZ91765.1 BZ3501_MvSof-1269-A2-R1_Chr2-1g04113 [Microbotryum saponariae]